MALFCCKCKQKQEVHPKFSISFKRFEKVDLNVPIIAITEINVLNNYYTEYLTVQVFFYFMNTCSYVIFQKAFSIERFVEKYPIFLNFSDNPGRRIYRQPPLPCYNVGLKWTRRKTQFCNGGEGRD